jgi:hypothetical protein
MPDDGRPHVFRWFVYIVRQIDSDEEDGNNWISAGNKSEERVFSWFGNGTSAP